MTAGRDPDRLIQAYLEEGLNELPDRAYDAVRSEIEHTRQRVVIGPWRLPTMSNFARYGVAAAAVVLVALLGIKFLPLGGVGPGASTAPVRRHSPLPPTSCHRPAAERRPCSRLVLHRDATIPQARRLTFTVPAGWELGARSTEPSTCTAVRSWCTRTPISGRSVAQCLGCGQDLHGYLSLARQDDQRRNERGRARRVHWRRRLARQPQRRRAPRLTGLPPLGSS